jgi:hypothetical protein
MAASIEANFYAIMDESFLPHSVPNTHFDQQINGALLQDPSSNPLFTVLPTSSLDHNRLNAL